MLLDFLVVRAAVRLLILGCVYGICAERFEDSRSCRHSLFQEAWTYTPVMTKTMHDNRKHGTPRPLLFRRVGGSGSARGVTMDN